MNNQSNEKSPRDIFKELCQPVVDFLYTYGTPHSTIIIDQTHAELLSGELAVPYELRD